MKKSTVVAVVLVTIAVAALAIVMGDNREPQETRDVESKEPAEVFPHVDATYREINLRWIKAYCKQRDIAALNGDKVRLFVQPNGIVSNVVQIDLANRKLTVYPGIHRNREFVETWLYEEQIAQIRALVTSPEFKQIPAENKKIGADGISYMVEVSIGDSYSWKLHWSPDDKEFVTVVDQILSLAEYKAAYDRVPSDAAGLRHSLWYPGGRAP